MKKFLLLLSFFVGSLYGFSQSLSHVRLSGATTLSSFSFTTNDKAVIKISPEGNIMEWGTESEPGRIGYNEGKLQPYMGRVDYYGQEVDEAFRGKVRNIGAATITYYASSQPQEQRGKIKSIGSAQLDYYMNYDNESFRGKLKTAGNVSIVYFSSFDNESLRGKLKSVGNSAINFYTVLDDKFNKGKIKTIGSNSFSWYNEMDRKELQGGMKTGMSIVKSDGVIYTIW